MAWSKHTQTCHSCGNVTRAMSSVCRYCQTASKRGAARAAAEGISVDQAGRAWWAWDRIGIVLAGPCLTRREVLIQLSR